MAGAAMAQTFDQIGAAIPDFRFRKVSLKDASLMKQRVPSRQQRPQVERKCQSVFWNLRSNRRLRHQIGIERLQVGISYCCEMRIGKRRIQMPAVTMDALAHRALEGGIGPRPDPALDVGGDV